jgi:hypothetical protein
MRGNNIFPPCCYPRLPHLAKIAYRYGSVSPGAVRGVHFDPVNHIMKLR